MPGVAISGSSGSQVSYTTLESDPTSASTLTAHIYANLTATLVAALTADVGAILPAGTIANVNYAKTDDCASSDAYKFVLTRLVWNPFSTDTETCGSDHLPSENSVLGKGCYVTVSVLNASSKLDVNATLQGEVFQRLTSLPVTCLGDD